MSHSTNCHSRPMVFFRLIVVFNVVSVNDMSCTRTWQDLCRGPFDNAVYHTKYISFWPYGFREDFFPFKPGSY